MPSFILAVDIGTTNAKALAVTNEGKVLASHQIGYPTMYPQPNYAEQDPFEILGAVKSCVAQVIKQCKQEEILCLTFSSAMHSLVAVDRNGQPLTNLIIWSDVRSETEAAELVERGMAQKIYEATGTPVHPMLPLFKLMWMKKHQQEVMNRAYKFLCIKDFIVFHFTGRWLTDYSMAGATGLFHLASRSWNPVALAEAGIHIEQLPELISTTEVFTGLKEEIFRELHLPALLKLTLGASDGCLANLGTNVIHPGELAVTVGTSGAVRMAMLEPKLDAQQRTFSYFLSEGKFIAGGATNNGAVLLQWFEEAFGKMNGSQSIYDDVEQVCKTDIEISELVFLPYILGERAPIYDAQARGIFFGLSIGHKKPHLLRATVEGICFSLRHIAESVKDVAGSYDVILASGGFIHSRGWLQLLSTIFGMEVRAADHGDASAMGAARLAFQALKQDEHFFDRPINYQYFFPDMKWHARYQKKYEIFLSLYQKLKQDFYNLSKLNKP